jgi:hypothetical protein
MKTVTRQRATISVEIPYGTRDFRRLASSRQGTQNPSIIPYKEEIGGSSPSTPTREIPYGDWRFAESELNSVTRPSSGVRLVSV